MSHPRGPAPFVPGSTVARPPMKPDAGSKPAPPKSAGAGGRSGDGNVAYVSFQARITSTTVQALLAACVRLGNAGTDTVHLLLSTTGGDVSQGVALYNMLWGMPFDLVTHNVGEIRGVGNVAFLAGARRFACEHATFSFDGLGLNTNSRKHFAEREIRDRLKQIQSDQDRLAEIIRRRCTFKSAAEIKKLFKDGAIKDNSFAEKKGIIQGVEPVRVPKGVPFVQLAFSRVARERAPSSAAKAPPPGGKSGQDLG
jgi:ATP-dependent Clp protease, protease subunit